MAFHCLLVPLAAMLSLLFDPIVNDRRWTPIIDAQISLIALYLGLGAGGLLLRSILALTGSIYVLTTLVLGTSTRFQFKTPVIDTWVHYLKAVSIEAALPPILAGLALIPLRVFIRIASPGSDHQAKRFRIADVLLATLLVSLVLAWYRYASHVLGYPLFIKDMATWTSFVMLGVVGCYLLVLSSRWWWIGLALIAVSMFLLSQVLVRVTGYHVPSWSQLTYQFTVVLVTLAAYRWAGVRVVSSTN